MLNELDLDRCERQRSRHSITVITAEEWTEEMVQNEMPSCRHDMKLQQKLTSECSDSMLLWYSAH